MPQLPHLKVQSRLRHLINQSDIVIKQKQHAEWTFDGLHFSVLPLEEEFVCFIYDDSQRLENNEQNHNKLHAFNQLLDESLEIGLSLDPVSGHLMLCYNGALTLGKRACVKKIRRQIRILHLAKAFIDNDLPHLHKCARAARIHAPL